MSYRRQALDNPLNWSFGIGRLFGIRMRVHIIFVICAVVLVAMEVHGYEPGSRWSLGRVLIDSLGLYALLFLIVLLHEFGHCFGARSTGGEADEILLWPLGGLAYVNPPHRPGAHLITTFAGPAVNVILCAICAVVLALWLGSLGAVPWNPIHPFQPTSDSVMPTTAQAWTIKFFGLSYFILLINLLPIFPFDGGRVVQALLWRSKGYHASMMTATATGMVGAVLVGLFALFLESNWVLLMIAVFGYITCWQQRKMLKEQGAVDTGAFGYDFSGGYTSLDAAAADREHRPGLFERRRQRKAARLAELQQKRDQEHEQAVEEALRKVSELGMDALTPQERRILEEETRRRQSTTS